MFRKLLAIEGTPKSLYSFPERETDKRLSFKMPSIFRLIFLSQCTRMFLEAVHFYLILEETALVILLKCFRIINFPPPIVIKTDTIVNKSAGVIIILFTAATNLSAGKNSDTPVLTTRFCGRFLGSSVNDATPEI